LLLRLCLPFHKRSDFIVIYRTTREGGGVLLGNPESRIGNLLGCFHLFEDILTQFPMFKNLFKSIRGYPACGIQVIDGDVVCLDFLG